MYSNPNLTETDDFFRIYFPNYEKLKSFCENIYSLLSNTYFQGTVMVQYGFLCLILTRPKLTVYN
jgi:hypothetical protein